jgi:Fe-S cluster assembly iron-binding protein IscA
MIKLGTGAAGAIKAILGEEGPSKAVRVELRSSGCCDPSLGLSADRIREEDLVEIIDGLTFVLDPEVFRLFGEMTISYRDEPGERGFRVTASRPVSEWEGFGVSILKA